MARPLQTRVSWGTGLRNLARYMSHWKMCRDGYQNMGQASCNHGCGAPTRFDPFYAPRTRDGPGRPVHERGVISALRALLYRKHHSFAHYDVETI